MKRAVSVAFIIAATCSLFLAMYAETAIAVYPGYSITVYGGADSVIDGKWTTDSEWDDAATAQISAHGIFRVKYYFFSDGTNFLVYDEYLVEFFTDKTNDANDYVQVCYDVGANGGAAPQTDDIRIDYVGHNGTVKTYKGTGTGWTPAALIDVTVAELVSISKLNGSNPHWTAEFKIEKTQNGPGIDNAIRVAMYDASNPTLGVQAWPPTSQDVPNDYGADPANTTEPISEGIGIGVIVALSSVAVLVGSNYWRKRPRIPNLNSAKR